MKSAKQIFEEAMRELRSGDGELDVSTPNELGAIEVELPDDSTDSSDQRDAITEELDTRLKAVESAITRKDFTPEAEFIFRPDGDAFCLKGFGEVGRVTANLKGLHFLFRLVQTPGLPVKMDELKTGPGGRHRDNDKPSQQLSLDKTALQQIYQEQMRLRLEIDESENELEKADASTRLDEVNKRLGSSLGKNGKPRDINNPYEKLRSSIFKRIRDACTRIRENKMPKLADHLETHCHAKNGDSYVYSPETLLTWDTAKK